MSLFPGLAARAPPRARTRRRTRRRCSRGAMDLLTESALAQPRVFVHRDYHSRNLMVCPGANPGILDFQDAVHGPLTYDLVSLLRDCYIAWPAEQVRGWMAAYRRRADRSGPRRRRRRRAIRALVRPDVRAAASQDERNLLPSLAPRRQARLSRRHTAHARLRARGGRPPRRARRPRRAARSARAAAACGAARGERRREGDDPRRGSRRADASADARRGRSRCSRSAAAR